MSKPPVLTLEDLLLKPMAPIELASRAWELGKSDGYAAGFAAGREAAAKICDRAQANIKLLGGFPTHEGVALATADAIRAIPTPTGDET